MTFCIGNRRESAKYIVFYLDQSSSNKLNIDHIIKDFGVKIKIHGALDSGCGPG
jgi:hypothetical protein